MIVTLGPCKGKHQLKTPTETGRRTITTYFAACQWMFSATECQYLS